uniref:Epi-inositol hydrolase (EC) n=1 Tax=uncultured Thiotrichaceae bacterium TaxID=298394 RepID=A0A6S6T8A5_9GAMM|nr:MAG: Epi-inositol hydrolase (EC [uncultured Thiotrichaceae bacterium]
MKTIRLTMAQALARFLTAQKTEIDGEIVPVFAGIFAIFGHGNVAGLGEALYQHREELPTYRGHNEQSMAHAAIAYAKASNRRRMMACTTSIGPGATNLVTAAALAHVNRIPVLLLPGDVFVSRTPDPVLQQAECPSDPTLSVNDCFKPVSRYFDRISRPEQIITSLPVAMQTLFDPETCGPVTIALPQDTQAEAYDYPESFFAEKIHYPRRPQPDERELATALATLKAAKKPFIVAGGGVLYSEAAQELQEFAAKHKIPVSETQAGKGAMPWDHEAYVGAIGVTGSRAANGLAGEADVVLAIGSRLQDFTTGSRTVFGNPDVKLLHLNAGKHDAGKHNAQSLVADAKVGLQQLSAGLADWQAPDEWLAQGQGKVDEWNAYYESATAATDTPDTETGRPTDAQVMGVVKRTGEASDIVVCAAGTLPADMHKFWRTEQVNGYHLEYGFSCMGYEVAGGMGVKMAHPDREVIVMVGDGSYLMMNSELATSVALNRKIIVVLLDNRGFGCINRLQRGTGGESFNNLLDYGTEGQAPNIDFAGHARSLGATAEHVGNLAELDEAMGRARAAEQSYVVVIDTDPFKSSDGGCWWQVGVPEVSVRESVVAAHDSWNEGRKNQPY